MTFPVYLPLGPWTLHPHVVFELLAYFVGFRIYLWQRRRMGDTIDAHARWSVVAAAILGAAIGSRLLFWLEDPAKTIARWNDVTHLLGGKTVVGALLGGLIAVEVTKHWLGIRRRTGDLFAMPLAAGIAIGRIGCFLAGLEDRTYGVASALPWAVDFGDGVRRHPTQIYEAIALIVIACVVVRMNRRPHPEGRAFQIFMVSYLSFRLLLDAIKPELRLALGLSAIQWAAVAALAYYAHDWRRSTSDTSTPQGEPA